MTAEIHQWQIVIRTASAMPSEFHEPLFFEPRIFEMACSEPQLHAHLPAIGSAFDDGEIVVGFDYVLKR